MNEVLTRERILEAAEQVFRRFGPQKTTVVDVARLLGVSHGSVYRHFQSKAALRDAVVEGWLRRTSDRLEPIAYSDVQPSLRLRQWFDGLRATKRKYASSDPELFSIARAIFSEAPVVISGHVQLLVAQIERIVADGIAAGEFREADPKSTAQAIFDAMARFHDPAHALDWNDPENDAAFDRVYALVTAAIAA